MTNDTIIFVHILKSGGTSVTQSVFNGKNYPSNKGVGAWRYDKKKDSPDQLYNRPSEELDKIRFLIGHSFFGVHKYLPNPSVYMTVVRNPVDRVLSSCFQAINTESSQSDSPWRYFQEEVKRIGIESIYDTGKYSPKTKNIMNFYLDNHSTRVLSGIYQGDTSTCPEVTEKDLEHAKSNIEKYFSFVCTTDSLDDHWSVLCNRFQWSLSEDSQVRKASKRVTHDSNYSKDQVSSDLIDQIRENNQLDWKLYKHISVCSKDINSRKTIRI